MWTIQSCQQPGLINSIAPFMAAVRLQDVVNKVNSVCLFNLTLKEVRPGRPHKYLNIGIRTKPSRSMSAVNSRIGTKTASMFDVGQSTQE
jgi:hypothetical protein